MADPDWLGRQPERAYWSADSRSVYFLRKRAGEETRDLYRIALSSGQVTLIDGEARANADARASGFDRERRRAVFVKSGDVFVRELARDGELVQMTRTAAAETSPFFTDAGDVAFRRNGAWFVHERETGLVWQPFDPRTEPAPASARAENDREAGYLERQQPRLFEIVRERRMRLERRERTARERQIADPSQPALPHYLGDEVEIVDSYLSPSLNALVLRTMPAQRDEGPRDRMPNYVTASGMVEVDDVRRKVGAGNPVTETLVLLRPDDREALSLDVSVLPGITDDPLADLREAARERGRERNEPDDSETAAASSEDQAAKNDEASTEQPQPETRPIRFGPVAFSRDGARAVVQITSEDNKDRWIAAVDLNAGKLAPLHRMSDPAWINWAFRDLGFLPDDRTIYFLSEETGYSHLMLMDSHPGTSPKQLTTGEFVVRSPRPSADGGFIYFEANPGAPGVFEIFRVDLSTIVDGGPTPTVEQVTDLGGLNTYQLSPDDRRLLIVHSTATRPPELWIQEAAPGMPAEAVTDTLSPEFRAVDWVAPQFIEIPSSHVDRPIHARLYLPPAEARGRQGGRSAVLFVHGAGYLQNAHQGWSSYFREFMFHTLLARRGHIVLDMDFRASAGYGRDWRTAIYRQMGAPELDDLADGIDLLVADYGVDRQRVGVYGGSYGGFVTLMAMFRRPELFAAGAALRPVTDWAHYNHRYTSNILNTPELDPEAYERSSPIEFAEGLRKPLLICTGMLDDNVFFQDSVRLVQRLIELGKEDWELAIYPAEAHGFVAPSSWLDEYRRILKLFETHLQP